MPADFISNLAFVVMRNCFVSSLGVGLRDRVNPLKGSAGTGLS